MPMTEIPFIRLMDVKHLLKVITSSSRITRTSQESSVPEHITGNIVRAVMCDHNPRLDSAIDV
jgi:hypothetical protein